MLYWVNQFAVAPDQPGGTRHFEMARELTEQGGSATIVASDLNLTLRRYLRRTSAADREPVEERVQGVEFVWLSAGSYDHNDWRRALSMLIFAWHVCLYLVRAPKSVGIAFVGSTPHLLAAAATWVVARLRRVPFVLEVRDLWPESMVGVAGRGGPIVRGLRRLSDVLYRRADAIIVLARPNIDHLVERGAHREQISYIPNGVDVSAFEEADISNLSLQLDPDEKIFAYTGAHGPANGLSTVVKAAKALEDRGVEGVRILLVGDGPAKAELKELAARLNTSNLTFADPIPKVEIPALLERCHGALMVLADVEVFRYGVSPNKLFDYLTAQVPVIANVPGEVTRIVEESGGGVSVPPADAEALADAIESMAAEPRRRTNARQWIRENHDRRKLARDLLEVIDSVR